MATDVDNGFRERVYALVRQIPKGRVMTYGQLAALAGNPRAARIVGGIAHFGDPELPWQRVVNKQGGLASGYPGGRAGHAEHLRAEGLSVSDDYYVNVKAFLWWPGEVVDSKQQTVRETEFMLSTVYSLQSALLPLVAVVGETASGKSAVGLELARRFDGEIVCADSWTVYKGFDIGTAKPSKAEQMEIPHHLIDIAEASDGFNAALYKRRALEVINDVHNRGKLPIMVGGTGLYVYSVLYDFSFMPVGPAELRAKRNVMTIDELLAELEAEGISLEGIDIRNKRRLIRLLESGGQRPVSTEQRPHTLLLGLKLDRETLNNRVERRVDAMLAAGLEQEVESLAERYGWEAEPMKGIGYREWREYFEGSQNLELTHQRIINATRQLAKRQRTWFKRNPRIQWLDDPSKMADIVATFLHK